MAVNDLNKKLDALAKPASTEALDAARWRDENRSWLQKSFEISLQVLVAIEAKGWSQKKLAEEMGVSPQQVSKIVKGKENFTLQTIDTLERILETKLIETALPVHAQAFAKGQSTKILKKTPQKAGSSKISKGLTASPKPIKRYTASPAASKVAEPTKTKK